VIHNVAGFDKYILRYYGAFPVFLAALLARHFISPRAADPANQTKRKKRK
jgi:hypothetical protein